MRPIPEMFGKLIKSLEALNLYPYEDIGDIPTIYFGHVIRPGEVYLHTNEDAIAYLNKDAHHVFECVDAVVQVPINDCQYSALGALAFNIGVPTFKTSLLLRYLNVGHYQAAADQFLVFDKYHKDGKLLHSHGLENRRYIERRLFLLKDCPNGSGFSK